MIAPRETWNTCSTLSQMISFRRVPIWQWLMKTIIHFMDHHVGALIFCTRSKIYSVEFGWRFFVSMKARVCLLIDDDEQLALGGRVTFSFGRSSRGVVYDTTWNSFETSGIRLHTVTSISSQSSQSHLTSHKSNSIQSNFRATQRNLLHHSHLALRQLFHFLQ